MRLITKRVAITSAPANAVLSVADVKGHLRVTHNAEDNYIEGLIDTATKVLERYADRKLITQTATLTLDALPGYTEWWSGVRQGSISELLGEDDGRTIELKFLPVQSVTSIKVYARDDSATTVASTRYRLDAADPDRAARVRLNYGEVWATTDVRNIKAFEVVYKVGYGDNGTDVPADILHAVRLLVSYMYNHRGMLPGEDFFKDTGLNLTLGQTRRRRL